MGGHGSGFKLESQKTLKVEDLLGFNINVYLKTKPAGYSPTRFMWYVGSTLCASILINKKSSQQLEFKYWVPVPLSKFITLLINLEKQPCHFGGFRYWLNCPNCERRCISIYLHNGYFQCRHCVHALYACQSESHHDRLYRSAQKLRKKLRADYNLTQPVAIKPKGMSWRKYTDLKIRADIAAKIATSSSIYKLHRLIPGL